MSKYIEEQIMEAVVGHLAIDVAVELLKKMYQIAYVVLSPQGLVDDEYMGHPHVTHGTYVKARESLLSQGYERYSAAAGKNQYAGTMAGDKEAYAVIMFIEGIDPKTDAAKAQIYMYERSYNE